MPQVAKSAFEWSQECTYISNTTDDVLCGSPAAQSRALRNFSNDRACFVRYCEMQRDSAKRDSRDDSAQYIDHCIDDLITT